MKRTGFGAALLAAALVLGACSSAGTPGSGGSGADSSASGAATKVAPADYLHAKYDELQQGGTLTSAVAEITEQSNPFQQDGTRYTSDLWWWYNPQLALFDDDGTWHFNPDYFDDVKASEVDGNTVVTYKIKKEATYNDGTPIDVKAFQNTWKSNNGKDEAYLPSSTDGYERIKSVEPGADDKEVVVTFDGIYAWWQGLFNDLLHPSIDTAEKYNKSYVKNAHPELGAGPYKVDHINYDGGEAVFVPNEKWWGPKGKLDKRVFKVMEDQASINAFVNGEIDYTGIGSQERLAKVKDMSGIKQYTSMQPRNSLLELNAAGPILKDIKVREAVMDAIDREGIANIAFQGLNYHESLPGSFLLFSTQPGYSDNAGQAVKYDPENSKKLLDEAGWKAGSDGIRAKNGEKLTLRLPLLGDDETIKNESAAIQQNLKAVGIDLTLDTRPSSDFSKVVTSHDFDLMTLAFSATDPFGVAYFGQIYKSDSGLNYSATGTEELDKKIKDLAQIGNPDEQIKAANTLEVEAFKRFGILPLYNGPTMVAVKDNLANYGAMGFAINPIENIGFVAAK
ncbi:MAG: ABC transporter family substrate-binding protein [Actinomycetaceae bacterium]|nr:ABC transporter family substrate-binding protein [Actinomycetaceae bacterium]MDY6083604.1 ABC transporter family substrate-binding protein [Actinomycetaceae bacterium]